MNKEEITGITLEDKPFSTTEWYSGRYNKCPFILCRDNSDYGEQLRVEWPDKVPFESEPEGEGIEEEIKNYYDEHRPYTT